MSTYFRPTKKIHLSEYKKIDGLEVSEKGIDGSEYNHFVVEGNYLHYDINAKGEVIDIYRFGGNDSELVLDHIEGYLNTRFISEYEEYYDDFKDEDSGVVSIQLPIGDIGKSE